LSQSVTMGWASDEYRERHEGHLRAIRSATESLEASRRLLVEAMKAARDDHVSLRAIADAAGISHEQVRRMVEGS
jgi:hypothetical protein